MNENLNLVEILKDCLKGTKLYSLAFGYVELEWVFQDNSKYPILIKLRNNITYSLTKDGKLFEYGECMLFPSKDQRDWSKFKPEQHKKPKFNPKTFQPFDKVLTKSLAYGVWQCDFFSNINDNNCYTPYNCISNVYKQCIPYNDDTKHLVGTTDEAPEFYRYWED